jgi:2-polyprenyl-6-methoxyphenol hydroxylase-like FAD-dependent oxidoreductase
MTSNHPIAIIGGGLAGLTLALILHRNGIPSTVFELDATPDARRQGGMLDMHEEAGQFALRQAGVYDEFHELVLHGGEATLILDRDATVLFEDGGTHGGRPEVDRGQLRGLLLNALPDDAIRWDAKVAAVRALDDGTHEVALADGTTFTTSLLVGADGTWSKVRALISGVTPQPLGLTFVEMHVPVSVDTTVAGNGSMFALADGRGILSHRGSDHSLHVAAAMTDEPTTDRDALLVRFERWSPALRALIADSTGPAIAYPINALPSGHRWQNRSGVTLIGDAAHVMSPFAGEGANLAMLDAAELAAAIIEGTPLERFERAMLERSSVASEESLATQRLCFAPDGAQALADLMNSFGPPAE